MNTLHHLAILSVQTAILALLAFLVTQGLRAWLTARARCWIWGLVVLRLCLPISLGAPFSLFNFLNPSAVVVSPMPRAASVGRTVEQPERSPRTAPVPLPGRIQSPGEPLMAEALSVEPARPVPSPIPTVAPASETATPWTWMIWATWAAGALAFMGRTAWLALRMHRTVARGVPDTSPTLAAALDHARRLTGVRQPMRVVILPGMHSPALHGGWRPTLLVPPSVEGLLTPAQLRHVLLHECAHVRRRDIALNWLMTGLLALHWFNPAVWLAFARLRAERELACDEIALEASGKDEGEAYGRTLLHLLTSWSDASPIVTPGALGLLERHMDLRRRLRHIADFRPGRRLGIPAGLILALVGAVTLTDAQSPKAATTNGPGAMALSSNLPPVVPLRYTNALAKPEDKDLHSGGNWAKAPRGSNVLGGVYFEIDGLV
ncbi:MAG: M56 family metallopeptidase, partial [Verrucomicrobiota bacterium]